MTNTILGATIARDNLDFNRTPAWVVELLVPHLGQPQTILDAGCGDGAIGKVLRQSFGSAWIVGIEADRTRWDLSLRAHAGKNGLVYNCVDNMDWLEDDELRDWHRIGPRQTAPDLIISNPPFGLPALDFLRCALDRVRPGGTVAFLLPTHWDHDPDAKTDFARQRFLDSIRLDDGREGYAKLAIVGGGPNPCRPSFRGGSSTATDRYAWFMFGNPWKGQPSRRLHAIPPPTTSTQIALI